jgi:hypothetical protein
MLLNELHNKALWDIIELKKKKIQFKHFLVRMLDTLFKKKSWRVGNDTAKGSYSLWNYFTFFFRNGWSLILTVGVPILLIVVPVCMKGNKKEVVQ